MQYALGNVTQIITVILIKTMDNTGPLTIGPFQLVWGMQINPSNREGHTWNYPVSTWQITNLKTARIWYDYRCFYLYLNSDSYSVHKGFWGKVTFIITAV